MGKKQILVVDDSGTIGNDLKRSLTGMGYAVPAVVPAVERALQVVEEVRPDLVLVDVTENQDAKGMEAARRMSSQCNVPVVCLSSSPDVQLSLRVKQTGAVACIQKPFKNNELHSTIEVALRRHEMERMLREREQWLATTINTISDIVITTDTRGVVVSLNTAAERMLGIDRRAAIGHNISHILRLETAARPPTGSNPARQILDGGGTGRRTSFLKLRDGRTIPVEDRSAQLRDDAGNLLGSVIVLEDLSERHAALEEIGRSNRELQSQVHELTAVNRELGTFNYSVSHGLRTPLITIDGYTHLLTEEAHNVLGPEARRYLDIIQRNTRSMLQSIDDMLLFARLSRSHLEKVPLDMMALGKAVFDELRKLFAPRPMELLCSPLPAANGDRAMIRLVLRTLFANGIKFTRSSHTARIEFGGKKEKLQCVYFVRDHGIGFEKSQADRLFEAGEPGAGDGVPYDGTGVGLAVALRIIEHHGGKMWAEASPNKGATLYFTLPLQALPERPFSVES